MLARAMPDATLPPLIHALLNPARHPQPVDRVSWVETHGAWVLLAGDHAYKIKKPVRLPFMDFGTLAQRRAACEAELRVNERFATADPATQLYQAVVPITGTADAPVLGGDPGRAIEWAVRMRRFPEHDRLDHVCDRGELSAAMVQSLARRLATFQSGAAAAPTDRDWGAPEGLEAMARDNLCALRDMITDPEAKDTLRALEAWTDAHAQRLRPLLNQRRSEGRVREGHGDLHLGNLVRLGDGVQPFDAIEFNDALRWIDTANDLAFLWMDLMCAHRAGLAHLLLSEWRDASGDVSAPLVLPFFGVYRALVRAKVAGIRGAQNTPNTHGPAAAPPALSHYLRWAARLADLAPWPEALQKPPAEPRLLITHGLSGSGKTWASTHWLVRAGGCRALRLRSDVERKRLHGLSALASSGSGLDGGLYAPGSHESVYASLLAQSLELLQQGWTVVVDAAFLRRHERQAFAALAQAQGATFHILACEAPAAVLRKRIEARLAHGGDASEATLAVLERQLGWLEPLDRHELAHALRAD